MYIVIGQGKNRGSVMISTAVVWDADDENTRTVSPVVHVTITRSVGDDETEVNFTLSPQQAHDVGMSLIQSAWQATKDGLRRMGETFRQLGFYH